MTTNGQPAAYGPYAAAKPPLPESTAELRARIPGWGADLDPADRPSVPREQSLTALTGAHWEFPERQPELRPRERSIEHGSLPPVFGTTCPPRGLSGVVRRYSYRRYSEARAAHWLLLLAADRIDVVENVALALVRGRPENPLRETGLRTEATHGGLASRAGSRRSDFHQALDPLVVAGPWLVGGWAVAVLARRIARRASGDH